MNDEEIVSSRTVDKSKALEPTFTHKLNQLVRLMYVEVESLILLDVD